MFQRTVDAVDHSKTQHVPGDTAQNGIGAVLQPCTKALTKLLLTTSQHAKPKLRRLLKKLKRR